jgi:hypothetical protein
MDGFNQCFEWPMMCLWKQWLFLGGHSGGGYNRLAVETKHPGNKWTASIVSLLSLVNIYDHFHIALYVLYLEVYDSSFISWKMYATLYTVFASCNWREIKE